MGFRWSQVRSYMSHFCQVYCINFSLLSNFLNGVCCKVGGVQWRGTPRQLMQTQRQNKLNANQNQNPAFCKYQLTVSWINECLLVCGLDTKALYQKETLYLLLTIFVVMISLLISPGPHSFPRTFHIATDWPRPRLQACWLGHPRLKAESSEGGMGNSQVTMFC